MKVQNVQNCSFSMWYSKFKDVTIKSRILDLPEEFVSYLCSDGTVVLPASSTHGASNTTSSDTDDEEINWESDNSREAVAPSFPEFEDKLKHIISALGGHVFPKLNWSSPKDATWIAMNNILKCSCPGDIYLLLKSSQFIAHDLTQPFDQCEDYDPYAKPDVQHQLILRRWHDINPGGEFRCFVKNKKLIGICQRHHSNCYPFIKPHRDDIMSDIMDFYNRTIKNKFPDTNYVFDVYRKEKNKVYVMDFNPWGEVTDGLMFLWDELQENRAIPANDNINQHTDGDKPIFRFIDTESGVQPSPYRSYGLPQDFVDLSTGSDPHKLMDFLQLKNLVKGDDSDSESSSPEEDTDQSSGNR